jgi:general stress protein YciG
MSGSNSPENLVEVTITQHAMFHFCNYQLWGSEEDRIAWRAISGLINVDEIKLEAQLLGAKKAGQKNYENGTGLFKMTPEEKSAAGKKGGKKGGEKAKELGVGVCGLTFEELSEAGKKGGKTTHQNGTGIFKMTTEQRSEASRKGGKKGGKKGGRKTYENGTGCFKIPLEERREIGRKSGLQAYENKTGIHKRTKEEMSEQGKKNAKLVNAQRWQCTKTGFISTPCGLSSYQKARGIDTSNRIRIN